MREQILFGALLARLTLPLPFSEQKRVADDVKIQMQLDNGLAQMHASLPPEVVADYLAENRRSWMRVGPPAHVGAQR